jgi:ribosomal protein S18 acetylase RimI-like enzyme
MTRVVQGLGARSANAPSPVGGSRVTPSGDTPFELSTDAARLDLAVVHGWLSGQTHWARGIARATVERAFAHSLWVGAFVAHPAPQQVGVARAISDQATFAYLCDVFVDEAWRGRGIARRMVEHLLHHPQLAGLRRVVLRSRDARGLYERLGFAPLPVPELWMERPGSVAPAHVSAV